MGVEFNEENIPISVRRSQQAPSGLVHFLVSKGIARDESQANVMLVVVLVICLVGIGYVMLSSGSSGPLPEPLPEPLR